MLPYQRLGTIALLSTLSLTVGCSTFRSKNELAKKDTPSGIEEEIVISEREKQEPTSRMYCDFGHFFAELGNTTKAIEMFQDAIEAEPKQPQNYVGLAKVYMKMKRPEEALQTLEKGRRKCRDSAEILNEMGVAYCFQNDYEKALKSVEKAIDLDPMNLLYKENLANILSVSGAYDESCEILSTIVPPAEANYRVASIAYGRGDFRESEARLQMALRHNPQHQPSLAMASHLTKENSGMINQVGYIAQPDENKLQSQR